MRRTSTFLLVAFALAVGGCSSGSNEGNPDSGTRDPNGDGGCRVEGYPCSPAEESPEARALSDRYVGQVQARLVAGESFEDIAAWLASQEDIVEVIGDSEAVRFRVTGGAVQWAYAPPPGITRPPPTQQSTASVANKSLPVSQKAVLRKDDSESEIKKKALVIEPFEEFIATPTTLWRSELEQLHDYDTVDYFSNRDVLDQHFGNWNDYRFIWVTTHGKHLPEVDPEYSALFSSRMCKESGWLREEILDLGNGDESTNEEMTPLRELFGRPRTVIEQRLTGAQAERLKAYEDREAEEHQDVGVICGTFMMRWIPIPGDSPSGDVLVDVPVRYWAYNEDWYNNKYGGELENAFLYLRACSSNTVPLLVAPGSRGAILGWSDTINSANDDLTIGVLFDRMIRKGETLADALKAVRDAGFDEFPQSNGSPQLVLVSTGDGGEEFRVREIITIVDPDLLVPLPDEGGVLEAKQITQEGHTIVDVTVEVVGFADRAPSEFFIRFFDGDGEPISPAVKAEGRFMTIPIEIREGIAEPKDVDIEARVSLPEGPEMAVSKHPISVTIEPPADCGFSVTVAGNEVTGQSKDVVSFQSADFQDGAIVQITLRQMQTGRTCTLGSIIDAEFPRVLAPGTYVGALGCDIGVQSPDTFFFSEIDMAPSLFISEYELTESLKGQLSGPVIVMGSAPDYPERWDSTVITFEIRVPPDYIPFVGTYECVIP